MTHVDVMDDEAWAADQEKAREIVRGVMMTGEIPIRPVSTYDLLVNAIATALAQAREERLRLAKFANSLLDEVEAFGVKVPDDPEFRRDAAEARCIVREGGA